MYMYIHIYIYTCVYICTCKHDHSTPARNMRRDVRTLASRNHPEKRQYHVRRHTLRDLASACADCGLRFAVKGLAFDVWV